MEPLGLRGWTGIEAAACRTSTAVAGLPAGQFALIQRTAVYLARLGGLAFALCVCGSTYAQQLQGQQQIQAPTVQVPAAQTQGRTVVQSQQNAELFRTLARNIQINYRAFFRTITAEFPAAVARQGQVRVEDANWNCMGSTCTLDTVSVPHTSLCKGIVSVQGQAVRRFGDERSELDSNQLRQCNTAARQIAVTGGFVAPATTLVVRSSSTDAPGPSGNSENLLNQFGDRWHDANDDFNTSVGWSPRIWQDGSDSNTFYYVPYQYRLMLQREGERPLALGFTHTYETEVQPDKTVLMTATFAPPSVDGDVALMEALANSAMRADGGEPITLQPYPIESVEVLLAEELATFGIQPEDIRVTGTPRNILEPISIRVQMTEVAQSNLLSLMRERDGIGGVVRIRGGAGHEASIPLFMSMRNVSGYPMPSIRAIQQSQELSNASFMPVTIKGLVGYVTTPDSKLVRRYRPLTNEPRLVPRQVQRIPANVANSFVEAFGDSVVHSWFDYEVDPDCMECLATVERMAESQVGLTRRDELTIEIPDFAFENLGVFKVTLQVRSRYFDSSGSVDEVRDYQLRPGEGIATDELFLDRSQGVDAGIGEYRMKVFYETGNTPDWTEWTLLDSTDLTLVTGDLGTGP